MTMQTFDDDNEDEEGDPRALPEVLVSRTLKDYQNSIYTGITSASFRASDNDSNQRIRDYLTDACQRQSCLVCLEIIRSTEPTWSCDGCYTLYHIVCIQRWVRDGVHQQQGLIVRAPAVNEEESDAIISHGFDLNSTEESSINWCCPKCRKSYRQFQCPTKYYCFCGKVVNPQSDDWHVPHSCGNVCSHALDCGHKCLLLCHPGPHPVCPVVVKSGCFCGQQKPIPRRCGARGWSCQKECNKTLSCKFHLCPLICHENSCPPCTERSRQPCLCGKEVQERACAEVQWQCENVCGAKLSCGKHFCAKVCHSGKCELCAVQNSGQKFAEDMTTCPCGKMEVPVSLVVCVDDIVCCGDTCEKLLECEIHSCFAKCHKNACPPCNQMITKRCRCLLKEKSVVCGQEFLCDVKCKRKRDCGRHACSRRCCNGQCRPCEQTCGRTLNCGQHKCTSPCHSGLCYPCPLTGVVTCFCKATKIRVPCGKEKKTRPPRCKKLCQISPDCHHPSRKEHHCHFGRCSPCEFICGKIHENCGHACSSTCHSAVLVNINAPQSRSSAPWEKLDPKLELVNQPCPPCQEPVPVKCLGGHDMSMLPCSEARQYSCGRVCGRKLPCGNHTCQKQCHVVKGNGSAGGVDCEECNNSCSLPRPADCTHKCLKPCHPASCDPCRQMLRRSCHCALNQKYIPCVDWSLSGDDQRLALLCCENRCPKLLSCGHRCTKTCHLGSCSERAECRKKVVVHCACKNRKDTIQCNAVPKATNVSGCLECDETCKMLALQNQENERALKEQFEAAEEERKRKEREAVEGRMGGKGRRRKRNSSENDESSKKRNNKLLFLVVGCSSVLVSIIAAFYLSIC